jgi:hypothetical protein
VVLAVFLLGESMSGSARAAGIAALIYAANPSFLFFDSQFAYESLALAFALTCLWATDRWRTASHAPGMYPFVSILAAIATIVTHHLTSLLLALALVAWAALLAIRPEPGRSSRAVAVAALTSVVAAAGWIGLVATGALAYLGEILGGGASALFDAVQGGAGIRQLFGARAAIPIPPLEVTAGYAGTALLLLLLVPAGLFALRHRRDRTLVVLFAAAAVAFPFTLALRFVSAGAEISQRASEFLYLPIGVLVADWLVNGARGLAAIVSGSRSIRTAFVTAVFAAGIVLGDPFYARMPGPYRVGAEQLSVEPQGISAAEWAHDVLGPERIVADRTNQKLMASYGVEYPVTAYNSHLGTAFAMFGPTLTADERSLLQRGQVDDVVADSRITRSVPIFPYYYESAEPDAGDHEAPWPAAGLAKFDGMPGVDRIYDSGDIVIYDISRVTRAAQ